MSTKYNYVRYLMPTTYQEVDFELLSIWFRGGYHKACNTAGVFVIELFDAVVVLDVGIFDTEVFAVTDEVFVVVGVYFVVMLVFAIFQIINAIVIVAAVLAIP